MPGGHGAGRHRRAGPARGGELCAVCARERPKVIVEGVVLLDYDHNMIDWIVCLHVVENLLGRATAV
jgi:hypothetical protein